jgi:DNA recombination protein RmuC
MIETVLIALAAVIAAGVLAIIVLLLRPRAPVADPAAEQRMTELTSRIQTMGEMLARAQTQLQQTVHERLDVVSQNLGQSMQTSTKNTTEQLQQLHARIAVIDSAQKNITDLSTTVSSLQKVFDNKQRRGAFGQGRLEAIVSDSLPKSAYDFQFTLSNRLRPDCCIKMPDNRQLVIDSKFPLEAFSLLERAASDEDRVQAGKQLRQDLSKHISDIEEKYFIPGETYDTALMFVPSESIYFELRENFDDIFQKAYRARIMIVSPTLLMLTVEIIRQIQKDERMREAADQIRAEVGHLVDDVERLSERVVGLQKHFGQANEDVRQILISTEKIEKRGDRIRTAELSDETPDANVIAAPMRKLEAGE